MDDSFVDWSSVKEIANHFPEAFLSIVEDVFPLVTSNAKTADVTKDLLALKTRFDLTQARHNDNQLGKYVNTLKRYKLEDISDSPYLLVYNRLKERLFKENPAMKYSKGSGSVFGHQLPNGEWVYHNLTSIQSSRLRDAINEESVEKLNSLKLLLFKLARWLKEPQDKYREALEQGFNVEFHQVVPVKRAVEDNSPESKRPTKALKQASRDLLMKHQIVIIQVISALAAETSSSGNALKIYLFAQSPLALSPHK